MTKREKKVVDVLEALIRLRQRQIIRENDKEEILSLYNQKNAYRECIYLLTDDEFLESMINFYKDF